MTQRECKDFGGYNQDGCIDALPQLRGVAVCEHLGTHSHCRVHSTTVQARALASVWPPSHGFRYLYQHRYHSQAVANMGGGTGPCTLVLQGEPVRPTCSQTRQHYSSCMGSGRLTRCGSRTCWYPTSRRPTGVRITLVYCPSRK